MKHVQITLLLGALIVGMPLLPLLAQNAGGQTPAPGPMPMGGMMAMGAMMETCQKNHNAMSGTMADLTKAIDAAKTSNNVSKLHEVLGQVQTALAKMGTQAKDCNVMMEHMQQMMPMPGSASH